MKTGKEELREKLAAIEHERWGDWQAWMMSQKGLEQPNGDIVLKADDVMRWRRQTDTPYAKLSEQEKQSDRRQVDRYWPIVESVVSEAYKQGVDNLANAITDQLAPITVWDGYEAQTNSLVYKLIRNAIAKLEEQPN